MKKLLLSSLFMLLSMSTLNYSHTPAPGPLTLGDTTTGTGQKQKITPGVILGTMKGNNDLQQEWNTIGNLLSQHSNIKTYQEVIDIIKNAKNSIGDQALEAFENTIMYIYHKTAFAIHIKYNPYFPLQGFRYSWLSPLAWIKPKSWIEDNNDELDQLINEFEQLANIAMNKNPIVGSRMKVTVHAYRHWRKYVLATISTYFGYDLYSRGWEKSTLCAALFNDTFENGFKNLKYDAKAAFLYSCLGFKKVITGMSNFIKPTKKVSKPAPKPAGWVKWLLAKLPSGNLNERKLEVFNGKN